MGSGWCDGRGLRLMTCPTLQVGWTALDTGARDGWPPERNWEVEDDDNSVVAEAIVSFCLLLQLDRGQC
jgi:hypothetical protein